MFDSTIQSSEDQITEAGAANLTLHLPGNIAVVFRSGILRHSFPVAQGLVPFTVNQDMKVLLPAPDVDAAYAFHVLRGLERKVVATAVKSGTTVESIDPKVFFRLLVHLPDLVEQRLIAQILDTLDEAIRKTEQLIAKLKLVKQGLLHDLLTRGIDENGELRDPERHPEQFKDSPLGRIPWEWEVRRLGGITEITSGTTPARSQPRYWTPAEIPWVKTAEVDLRVISSTEEKVSKVALAETSLQLYPAGTVLVAMYGQGATRGRVGILGIPATSNQACAALPPTPQANSKYIFHYLHMSYDRLRGLGHGSNQTNLSSTLLASMLITLPLPEEQGAIAEVLHAFESRVSIEISQLAKLRLLKTGLMDDLLTGRVRVTPLLEGER